MTSIFTSLLEFFAATATLIFALLTAALTWLPLWLWCVFWLFAVDWHRLRRILVPRGGMIPLVMIGLAAAYIVAQLLTPWTGSPLTPLVQSIIVVTGWLVVMMACGTAQLLGWTHLWVPQLPTPTPPPREQLTLHL